jgi:tetratricopeptide (TPR) repeat protein
MRELLKFNAAAVVIACALAPCAWAQAQTPEAQKSSEAQKPAEAVRERRVEASGDAGAAPRVEAKESGAKASATDAKADASDAKAGADAEFEALRAQAEAAATPAERGRLRQALAERLAEGGRRAEAVELLRSMLAEERLDPAFFYNAGNALARLGESESAADAYRKAIAQRRGNYARAEHNLGVVLTRLGRWEEAEEALQAALKLESYTYAEASYSLGRLYALRGETDLAAAEWSRTLRLKPDHADAAAALARTLAEGGDAEQALAVLDSFAARAARVGGAPPREITVARGEIVAAANVERESRVAHVTRNTSETLNASETRNASAARVASEVRSASESRGAADMRGASPLTLPTDTTAILRGARAAGNARGPFVANKRAFPLLLDARAARADDRPEEAAALYRRVIKESGGYLAPANLELGLTLISLRHNEEAAANLLAVVRKEGARYPLVFYHLGRIYEHLDRLGEAGEAYARAAELAGEESPQFYLDLSRVREREGRSAEALAAAERYVNALARKGLKPDWARERVEALRKQTAQAAPAKQ